MRLTKKTQVGLAICGMVAVMGVGGTIAYLTDKTGATNTFTFGEVKVDTLEPNWDPDKIDENNNGIPDVSEFVVPNQEIPKDPKCKNVGQNPAIVFIKLTVPVENVTRVADNGTAEKNGDALDRKLQEVFYFKDANDLITSENNNFHSKWVNLPEEELGYEGAGGSTEYLDLGVGKTKTYTGIDGANLRTYVFGYNERLTPEQETDTLFDKVQIKNIIENEVEPGAMKKIQVETFSIQADNIVNDQGAIDTSGTISHDTLKEIYDIYIRQNPKFSKAAVED